MSRAKKKFKVGDKVCIISDKATKRDRNFVSYMKECIGKVGTVEKTPSQCDDKEDRAHEGKRIKVLGWWWNVKDIKPKKPNPARVWTIDRYWDTPDIYVNGRKFCDARNYERIVKELNRLERKIARLEGR